MNAAERLWLMRLGAIMREASAALVLTSELWGDGATVAAMSAGDGTALGQTLDAFSCLTVLRGRLDGLGSPPLRLRPVGAIVDRAFAAFAAAAETYSAAILGGVDVDALERVPALIDEGSALLAELHGLSVR